MVAVHSDHSLITHSHLSSALELLDTHSKKSVFLGKCFSSPLRLALLWNISEGEPVIIWAHGILFIPVFADYCVVVVAMPPGDTFDDFHMTQSCEAARTELELDRPIWTND